MSDPGRSPVERVSCRRRRVLVTAATAIAGGTAGCLDGSNAAVPGSPTETAEPLEVMHGWIGERRGVAMDALLEGFHAEYPETQVEMSSVADANVPTLAERRIENGESPGVFLVRLGDTLHRFAGQLADVSDSVWPETLRAAFPELVREASQLDGDFVGAPLGVHRVNELHYSPAVLAAAGVDPETIAGVDDLSAAFDRIEHETDVAAFAHGMAQPWTTAQLLEVVLLAMAGTDTHRRLIEGSAERGRVAKAVEAVRTLLAYTPAGASEWGMLDAADAVATGEAAFVQQGSWIGKDLTATADDGADGWDRLAVPGTGDAFVLDSQGYVVPDGTPRPESAHRWLSFLASEAGQRAVTEPTSMVPARSEITTMDEFSRPQRTLYREYEDATARVPTVTHGLGVTPAVASAYVDAVAEHVPGEGDATSAATAVLEALADQP